MKLKTKTAIQNVENMFRSLELVEIRDIIGEEKTPTG